MVRGTVRKCELGPNKFNNHLRKENTALGGGNTIEGIEKPTESESVNIREILLVPTPTASATGAGGGLFLIVRLGVRFLLIFIFILVLGTGDRTGEGSVKVLKEDYAARWDTTHESGEGRVIYP